MARLVPVPAVIILIVGFSWGWFPSSVDSTMMHATEDAWIISIILLICLIAILFRKKKGQTEVDLGGSQEDRLLARRCLDGEVTAWQELHGRFHGFLCIVIREMLGPDGSGISRVDEVVSRVWHALARNDGELLNHFDPTRHIWLSAFLCGVAQTEVTKYLRGEDRS